MQLTEMPHPRAVHLAPLLVERRHHDSQLGLARSDVDDGVGWSSIVARLPRKVPHYQRVGDVDKLPPKQMLNWIWSVDVQINAHLARGDLYVGEDEGAGQRGEDAVGPVEGGGEAAGRGTLGGGAQDVQPNKTSVGCVIPEHRLDKGIG